MSEPDITALARRLAEQNNVDWRGLDGTGEGGRIVERDVLDYLARVMAGEEALDPTPEPLPDGMEAWPDQDPALRQAGQATTLGELRQEIGSAVRDDPAPSEEVTVTPSTAAVDEDVFLFDDEPVTAAQPLEDEPAGEPAGAVGGDELEDLLVSGDDAGLLGDEDDIQALDAFGASVGQADEDAFSRSATGDTEEFTGAQWGEGISLGGHEHAAQDDAPDIWGEPQGSSEAATDLFADSVTASVDDDPWVRDQDGAEEADTQDPWSHGASADRGTAEQVDRGTAEPDVWAAGMDDTEAATTAADPWASGETEGEPADVSAAEHERADVATGTAEEVAGGQAVASSSGWDEPEAEPTWSQATAADAELSEPTGEAASLAGIPLARTGTVLRRHVDVTALAGAQLSVSQELGHDEPLGAGPFVLRAVAKAARDQGVGRGQVALATFDGGLTLRRVDDAAGRPFAELVGALSGPGQEEDEAGLVVADLSSLDLDEVVLDVDLPVVSLGRMLYDNQRGGYRSTLTLTGDLPAEQGARLLGRVAELLDAPIRLVM